MEKSGEHKIFIPSVLPIYLSIYLSFFALTELDYIRICTAFKCTCLIIIGKLLDKR